MQRTTSFICILMSLALLSTSCAKKGDQRTGPRPVGIVSDLLEPDLSNCNYSPEGWKYENGELTWLQSKGDVWTKDQYGDFILELDWRIVEECNSGVIIRCSDPNQWLFTGLEVQIHESGDSSVHGQCGAVYSLVSPTYYETAKLIVTQGAQTQQISASKGQSLQLDDGTTLKIQKVYANLKMLERKGKLTPYNASSELLNPALMVQMTPAEGQAGTRLVYSDATKNEDAGPMALTYQLGHWVEEKDVRKPVGEWNHMKITAAGPVIQVELNNTAIVDINLDEYTEVGKNPQGTFNKYQIPVKDMARTGYIALQDHGHKVDFRNIKIKPLK
jgi:hypothetical protein